MKLQTITKVGVGLEIIFRHPAMNVLIMFLTIIAIPVTAQKAEEWYDVLLTPYRLKAFF